MRPVEEAGQEEQKGGLTWNIFVVFLCGFPRLRICPLFPLIMKGPVVDLADVCPCLHSFLEAMEEGGNPPIFGRRIMRKMEKNSKKSFFFFFFFSSSL